MNACVIFLILLFGWYAYGRVHSDQTARRQIPIISRQITARASYDIRNQVNVNGSLVLPFGFRVSPNITYSSAPHLTSLREATRNGDTVFNDRPAFEPAGFGGPQCPASPDIDHTDVLRADEVRATSFRIRHPA